MGDGAGVGGALGVGDGEADAVGEGSGDGDADAVGDGEGLGDASCPQAAVATDPAAKATSNTHRDRKGRDKTLLLPDR